jgi:hypothetical protein
MRGHPIVQYFLLGATCFFFMEFIEGGRRETEAARVLGALHSDANARRLVRDR